MCREQSFTKEPTGCQSIYVDCHITTGVQPHAGFTIHPSSQSSTHNQITQLQNPRSAGRLQRLVSQRAPACQLISQSATSLCHARTPFRHKPPPPPDFSTLPAPSAKPPPLDASALCALFSFLSTRHKPQAHSARPCPSITQTIYRA